ncbi:MAG: hypothetical protein ACLPHP_18090 [Candidatus Sulfotelmatobacter sp.]
MSGGDWSTGLGAGNLVPGGLVPGDLTPASAVRPVESHAANQDASGAPRRRARQKEEEDPDEETESGDQPEHRLDDLA